MRTTIIPIQFDSEDRVWRPYPAGVRPSPHTALFEYQPGRWHRQDRGLWLCPCCAKQAAHDANQSDGAGQLMPMGPKSPPRGTACGMCSADGKETRR